MSDLGQDFLAHSRSLLREDFLPKTERCVLQLPEEKIWWRPNEQCNAVGNLLLHLAGNIRQWIVHGVGGAPCVRQRAAEFAAREGDHSTGLLKALRDACAEADDVLSELASHHLRERRTIQGIEVTVMQAIYHVMEHFSGHLGQIIYITKWCTQKDLGFWVIGEGGTVQRGWIP